MYSLLFSPLLRISVCLSLFAFNMHASTLVEHSQGQTTVSDKVNTVVTFDLATLDTLDALGVEIKGLPKKILPERLQHYSGDSYVNVGSLFEPDYEQVAALQPDLIVVANRSSRSYKQLSKLAPTIDLTVWGDGIIDQFKQSARTLGELFDKSEEVEARLTRIDESIQQTRNIAKNSGKSLIVMTNGGKLTAYGEGSRFGWLHTELGVEPVAVDLKEGVHGDPISFEYLLEANPDILFVVDRDNAIGRGEGAAQATLDNALVKQTKAYKNDRIIYLNSTNWYVVMSGLNTVQQMIDEVYAGLSR